MTFREKLKQEKPWAVNYGFGGGCCGCPHRWGYEEFAPDFCVGGNTDGRCWRCWDRVIPGTEPDNKEGAGGLRPCEVDGRRGWFHRFVEEERGLLQIDVFKRCESVALAERTFKEDGVIPPGCSMEKVRHAWALVEFLDGSVKKVEPETVRFIDGEEG